MKVERILDALGQSARWLALAIGESPQTLSNWLDKPDSPKDPNAWARIAKMLEEKAGVPISVKQLLDENEPVPVPFAIKERRKGYAAAALPASEDLLELLLELVESKEEPPERKEVAKDTIRRWFRERVS